MLIRNKYRRKFIIESIIIFGAFVTSLTTKNDKILVELYTKKKDTWMLHLNDY